MHYIITGAHTYQVTISDKERRFVEKFIVDVESGDLSRRHSIWPEGIVLPHGYTRKTVLVIIKNVLKGKATRGNTALDIVCGLVRFCLSYYD